MLDRNERNFYISAEEIIAYDLSSEEAQNLFQELTATEAQGERRRKMSVQKWLDGI